MSSKIKYEKEYSLKGSANVLYPRLSTPSGLSDWFADDVDLKGTNFIFRWNGSEQEAEILAKRSNSFIRYRWVDEEDDDAYFEFKLNTDELTNEIALIVTDFAEPDEIEEAKELWDTQIGKLKKHLGI